MLSPNEKMEGAGDLLRRLLAKEVPTRMDFYYLVEFADYIPPLQQEQDILKRRPCDILRENIREIVCVSDDRFQEQTRNSVKSKKASTMEGQDVTYLLNRRLDEILQDEDDSLRYRVLAIDIDRDSKGAQEFADVCKLNKEQANQLVALMQKAAWSGPLPALSRAEQMGYMVRGLTDPVARQQTQAATAHQNIVAEARKASQPS